MTGTAELSNLAHEQNLAHLDLVIAAVQRGDRLKAIELLLTFRHHETRCIRERRASGVEVPPHYYRRLWIVLRALKALIMSRMQAQPEEAL